MLQNFNALFIPIVFVSKLIPSEESFVRVRLNGAIILVTFCFCEIIVNQKRFLQLQFHYVDEAKLVPPDV